MRKLVFLLIAAVLLLPALGSQVLAADKKPNILVI